MTRLRRWSEAHALSRRRLLARAAAGGTLLGVDLLAVGAGARAARPAVADPAITLRLGVDWEGLSSAATQVPRIMDEIFAHFSDQHRGVRVVVTLGACSNGPNNTCADCDMSSTLAGLMAGDGLDVFSVCGNEAGLVRGGLVAPLLPLLQRDNVPLDTWPANTVSGYMFDGQLYFLPSEEQPQVLTYNRAILDQMGLREPDPDWTYTQAADLWRAATRRVNGHQQYGLMGALPPYGLGRDWPWVLAGFGGSPQDASYTRATFNTPQNLQAAHWVLDIVRSKSVTGGDLYGNLQAFTSGQCVFINTPSWAIANAASGLRGMDWRFIPYPVFPKGRATPNGGNPYALSGTTKYAEAAWELLKWICVEPTYWRYEVRVSLNTPAQTALWPEYTAAVLSIAPDLRDKGVEWFADAQLHNYGFPGHPFRYADDQAQAIISRWSSKIWSLQVSPEMAFAQIDAQVNALERSAAATSTVAAHEAAATERELRAAHSGHLRVFSAPPRAGIGAPARPASGLVTARAGVFTLLGTGGGLHGTTDDGTFACGSATASRATFVCRLTSLANVDESEMDKGAKVGLMLRGDLSDDAPMVALVISGHEGVIQEARGVDLVAATHQKAGNAAGLLLPYSKARGRNFLKAPLWLKIVRDLDVFSAFTSPDGKRWTSAGTPSVVRMAGAWAGLFATSHEPGKRVRATFDQVAGFAPTTFVVLGSP